MNPPHLITTGQAATILGVSVSTVRRLIEDGHLRAYGKLPGPRGVYLIDEADVRAYASK